MDYIIAHWSELNLADRTWFIAGGWLLILFFTIFSIRIWRAILRKGSSPNESPSKQSSIL